MKLKNKLTNALDSANTKSQDWGYVVPMKGGKPTNFEIKERDRQKQNKKEI